MIQEIRWNKDLIILKINASKNKELSGKYKIQAVPALFYIKNGETVSKRQGYQSADTLEKWVFKNE